MKIFQNLRLHRLNLLLIIFSLCTIVQAEEVTKNIIELHPSSSGTYTISGQMAPAVKSEFLLDTGATMVMISNKLFKEISKHQKTTSTGKVAASMANGKVKTIPTYSIPSLVLGNGCEVGPVEVAVVRGASRNLIGLNALSKLGAMTLDIQHATLSTTECPKTLLTAQSVVVN